MARSNPFPVPTPLQRVSIEEIVRVARITYERGWNSGTAGNFSVRGSGRLLWQSPSGVPKGSMRAEGFIAVDMDTGKTVSPGAARPSAETPVHAAIYRLFDGARAVVHVHCPHLVMLSNKGEVLAFEGKEMTKALGTPGHEDKLVVPVIANTQDMDSLGARLEACVNPEVPLLVLREHGVYAWGTSPLVALNFIESAEFLCQTY